MRLSTNKGSIVYCVLCIAKRIAGRKSIFLLAACSVLFLFFSLKLASAAGKPKSSVYIKKLKNGHYQLIVERKPYIVKGVCYSPIPIGQSHGYDWWSDPNKPWLTDGKLMQEMGVNTVRIYEVGNNPESVKKVINDLYRLYGIRTILGHWLGFWEYPCPFYASKDFQEKIKEEVLEMVSLYKDEPGVLFWILGNENNYSCFGRVANPWPCEEVDNEPNSQKHKAIRARIYYSFVNDIARRIKEVDPSHPVALGNGELLGLEFANEYCPEADLVACIIYRGKTFGNLFRSLRATFDRPVLISEFGADAYDAYLKKEDQNMQAFFLESQWRQIYENLAKNKKGEGNCIGATMFEWQDEWWKHNESDPESYKVQDTQSNWYNSSYYLDAQEGNKNMNEEWFGIAAQSEELEKGINKRILRKSYYIIRDFWRNPSADNNTKDKPKFR